MVLGLRAARGYLDMGMDAIPLYPLSKRARSLSWQRVEPSVQWEKATEADNIGIRGGGALALAFFDSDDKIKPTWHNVVDFLWGLGLEPGSYPVDTTAHNGRRVYLSLMGELDGDSRNFNDDFGAGEFRYGPGALVVVPPSELPDGIYQHESGDLRNIPRIHVRDILPILSNQVVKTREERRILKPSRRALALLQGQGVETYSTRSEAEQAIVTSLVNSGYDFSEVLGLFESYPAAGKFRALWNDDPKKAIRWLQGSFDKAAAFVESQQSPARETALSLLQYARSIAWPGLTGSTDRAVYLAHLSIAIRAAKLTYSAGSRELAELAGVNSKTAAKANHRLIADGLLSLATPAIATLANQYRLEYQERYTPYKSVRECTTHDTQSHDAFRRQGLGKAAGEIYAALLEEPGQTLGQLVKKTGRGKMTVWRALRRMSKMADTFTGEFMPMVEHDGETWRALEVDLDKIAHIVGTAGIGRKQKALHARERAAHRRDMETGKITEGVRE